MTSCHGRGRSAISLKVDLTDFAAPPFHTVPQRITGPHVISSSVVLTWSPNLFLIISYWMNRQENFWIKLTVYSKSLIGDFKTGPTSIAISQDIRDYSITRIPLQSASYHPKIYANLPYR